jgi:hypothetical protein
MADGALRVELGSAQYRVGPGEPFTFGRAENCTICLDPDDAAISRTAGTIVRDGRLWWLINTSSSRHLAVVDELGLRSVLAPGRRVAVEGRTRVVVEGTRRSHELVLHGPQPAVIVGPAATGTPVGAPTSTGEEVMVNRADRLALVALFGGYLEEGERYDPYPRSYAGAAKRLGWPRTTLVKRIEYLRTRLSSAGVPNLHGWNAMTNLAEYVLTTGLITRDDLDLLR